MSGLWVFLVAFSTFTQTAIIYTWKNNFAFTINFFSQGTPLLYDACSFKRMPYFPAATSYKRMRLTTSVYGIMVGVLFKLAISVYTILQTETGLLIT